MWASTCAPFSSSALSSTKLCTIPNFHELLGITKAAPPPTSICIGNRHVIRGQASSKDNKGKEEEEEQIQELRTCRICKKLFQPIHNHPQACRYHSAHFGGGFGKFFLSFSSSIFHGSFPFFLFLAYLLIVTEMSLNASRMAICVHHHLHTSGFGNSPFSSSFFHGFFLFFCLSPVVTEMSLNA